ncbi:MAG TPA: metallophosphoesterase, partial [Gemmatimonadales bacterium]|nr:metallophosphoesterase [Gemmatimonadales bacterium]
MMPPRNTAVAGLVAGIIALTASSAPSFAGSPSMWPYTGATAEHRERAPVLVAIGDISCQPGGPVEAEKQSDVCDKTGAGYQVRWQAQIATADEVEAIQPDLVAILGDEQYEVGRYQDFMGSFDHTYGAFKFLQRPAPGNHEFYSEHGESGVKGAGYFAYYNGYQVNSSDGSPVTQEVSAGDGGAPVVQPVPRQDGQAGHFGADGDGWYSYNLGSWHIISLNAECAVQPGGCNPDGEWLSKETAWLERDLATDHAQCTVAYWHQPTFSAADTAVQGSKFTSPEGTAADTWWKLLYRHGADLVLNGHDH